MNTHEAKSRLSELLKHVEAGDEVFIARNGAVVAQLVPAARSVPPRTRGMWKGQVRYGEDVVGSDPDVTAMFDESAQQL